MQGKSGYEMKKYILCRMIILRQFPVESNTLLDKREVKQENKNSNTNYILQKFR